MSDLPRLLGPLWAAPARRDLLSTALRGDLTDLNEEYLDLGLGPDPGEDPRFCWPEPVRSCLEGSDRPTRSRIAAGPFAVFELLLPAATPPVVAARGGAIPDTVGDAALLVPAGDTGALRGAIARVLSEPALARELAERGALRAKLFRWDRSAARVAELLLAASLRC